MYLITIQGVEYTYMYTMYNTLCWWEIIKQTSLPNTKQKQKYVVVNYLCKEGWDETYIHE